MEQETNYGEQSTSGKKRKMPVIIGIASAIVVIAIICVAVIAVRSNDRDRNDNNVANNTEKPTTEIATEAKNADEYVPDIVNEIMASPDYVSSMASLGVYGDFNDDGVKELLLTYKTKGNNVTYSLLQVDSDGGEIIREDTLYEEAGGNSGYCGVTEYNGEKYFTLVQKIPNGSGYLEYINLFPWDSSGEKLTNDGSYYFECAVNIDTGNATYIYGDQKISMEEYDAKKNAMSWIHKLDPNMGPDPAYTASFDELLAIGSN